jgi:putative hydrolase of the HAD superfamily
MSYQVIFFDLDGTISDYKEACNVILRQLHDDHPELFAGSPLNVFEHAYWEFFRAKEVEQRAGKIQMAELQNRELRFQNVLRNMGIDEATLMAAAPSLADGYDEYRQTAATLFPGATDTLAALKGRLPMGIITQGRGKSQRGQIARLGVTDYFDHIFVTEEVGHTKPNLELYAACLRQAAAPGEHAIMVGDRLDWDLEPAKRLGMTTIEADPAIDYTAANHGELLPLLEELLKRNGKG